MKYLYVFTGCATSCNDIGGACFGPLLQRLFSNIEVRNFRGYDYFHKTGQQIMYEIRFHGRGGQGTVVASILLAKAFFKTGYYVQTFPLFGVERRGAPVESYLRLDKEKILIRSNIYTPDHIVVQDMKLIHSVDVTKGLKSGGSILINSRNLPDNIELFSGFRLAFVDANHIAASNGLGTRTHPIINTAMIGAFARVLEMPPLNMVAAAIKNDIHIKAKQNVSAAQQAYEEVNLYGMVENSIAPEHC